MQTSNLQDKCRGSLIGGAIGDALGYAVEFSSLNAIRKKYGENGIADYALNPDGIAEFSDDTQMSLFTAEGLLDAISRNRLNENEILVSIRRGYEHWYATQTRTSYALDSSWLSNIKSLWSERAPGTTCMMAMHQIAFGDGSQVENDSKGCGGVMRVAPIGIYSAAHPDILGFENAGVIAGKAANITHKHPLSTFSSMAFAMLVSECIIQNNINRDKLRNIVIDRVFKHLGQVFRRDDNLANLFNLILKAMALSDMKNSDYEAIRELGQGWVAEETLAIAVFSVMRYLDDFEKCICCAVNHDGASDSTGAVAGNIIGAILGYSAIPQKYLPVSSCPVLASGKFSKMEDLVNYLGDSNFISAEHIKHLREEAARLGLDADRICRETDASRTMEGIYIKVEENGEVVDRMKYVRASFLQTVEESQSHWLDRPIVPNRITVPITELFL